LYEAAAAKRQADVEKRAVQAAEMKSRRSDSQPGKKDGSPPPRVELFAFNRHAPRDLREATGEQGFGFEYANRYKEGAVVASRDAKRQVNTIRRLHRGTGEEPPPRPHPLLRQRTRSEQRLQRGVPLSEVVGIDHAEESTLGKTKDEAFYELKAEQAFAKVQAMALVETAEPDRGEPTGGGPAQSTDRDGVLGDIWWR